MELSEIITKIEALEARAAEAVEKAKASNSDEEVAGFKAMLTDEIVPEIERLKSDREKVEREAEVKAMQAQVTTLEEVVNELKKPIGPFAIGGKAGSGSNDSTDPYEGGEFSYYADVKAANKGRQDAIERLGGQEGKAMTEGVGAQGGYLVQKSIERQIVEARELDNVVRALCSSLTVNTTEIELNQISLGTTAGWVAELAQKPESTSLSLATVTASVFTAAGLATISNQLLADSNPAVDRLVTTDLSKRLVALEEAAFLAGTGTGQPLGLLNTPGVLTQPVTNTDVTNDAGLLAAILDAIAQVEDSVDAAGGITILMRSEDWTKIIKSKDAQGHYTISPVDTVADPRTQRRGPAKSLFGYRVVTSNRLPNNAGVGGNERRAIVGDFSEALILDRQGITVDESPHVYFTSNQTVFRAECRVGFTAARRPQAFCVLGGAGLV